MTVCIAAMAAGGNAIVMIADRSISMVRNGRTVLKTDSAVTKLRLLPRQWVALISGKVDFGNTVLSWAEDREKFEPSKHLVERVKLAYQEARKIEICDRVLAPSCLDFSWYERRVSSAISDDDILVSKIFNEVNNYDTETRLMLCGFENGQAAMYIISDPGQQNSAIPEGFGIIGIGEDAARSRLFKLKTNPQNEIGKVLYDLYGAKESCAELLPEVGKSWDGIVLVRNKIAAEIPANIKDLIGKLYTRHPPSPYIKANRQPENWGEILDSWSETLFSLPNQLVEQDHLSTKVC